jgi:hypothetical protein
MENLLDGIEEVLLMGPGPSCVHDQGLRGAEQKIPRPS